MFGGLAGRLGLVMAVLAHTVMGTPFLTNHASCRDVRAIIPAGPSLWLATSGGLVHMNQGDHETRLYSMPSQLPDINLTAALRTGDGTLWLGSGDGYLAKFNTLTGRFVSYNGLHASGWDITCLAEYKDYLLLGSSQGLSVFSRSTGASLFNARAFGSFDATHVKSIDTFGDTIAVLLADGVAWMAPSDIRSVNLNVPDVWSTIVDTSDVDGVRVDANGVHVFQGKVQESGGAFFELRYTEDDAHKTTLLRNGQQIGQFPWQVYCAAEGDSAVFVGTKGHHVYKLHADGRAPEQIVINSAPGSDFRSCALDQNGCLWTVTDHISDGIGIYCGDDWQIIETEDDGAPGIGPLAGARPGSMNRVFVASNNDVWVGTFAHGAKWLNRDAGIWKHFDDTASPHYAYPSPIARYTDNPAKWWSSITAFCEDASGNIWMGNQYAYDGNIVHVFDPHSERWRSLNRDVIGSGGDYVYAMDATYSPESGLHTVYIGLPAAANGSAGAILVAVSFKGDPITADLEVSVHPTRMSVYDIKCTSDSLAWLATGDGLYRLKGRDGTGMEKIEISHASQLLFAVESEPHGWPVVVMRGDLWEYRGSVGNYGEGMAYNLTRSGLLPETVYRIVYDAGRGGYWLSTDAGLFLFRAGEYPAAETRDFRKHTVYPNPFSMTRGAPPQVTFDKLPPNSQVSLYDMGGNLVWMSARPLSQGPGNTGQRATWKGTNAQGKPVMPGSYYYCIDSDGKQRHVGKLMVIP